jgi:hypothetical protein
LLLLLLLWVKPGVFHLPSAAAAAAAAGAAPETLLQLLQAGA